MGRLSKASAIAVVAILSLPITVAAKGNGAGGGKVAADSTIVKMANTINRFNRVFPQEKVYLHFDNTGYFMGETIWFNAYVQTTNGEGLGSKSSVLYVELVDPSGSVFTTKKLKIENGQAHGDIQLNNLALSGFYQVRAYTRYMLNWGRNAVFTRTFPIFKANERKGDYGSLVLEQDIAEQALRSKTVDDDGDTLRNSSYVAGASDSRANKSVNVRFYPEGGGLVEGLESRVAFECFDEDGKPLKAEGWLMDGEKRLCKVATEREGRGVFSVKPKGNTDKESLRVEMTLDNGKTRLFTLPQASKSGAVMTIDTSGKDSIGWQINVTDDLRGVVLGQVFIHNGQMYHCNIVGNGTKKSAFARKDMPAGVNQIALTDTAGNIYSDRLVFIFPRTNDLATANVAATDSTIWPGKKVRLDVTSVPNASLSVAVCDAETQTGGNTHNAATWYLLTSDLKGYINHPEYYLESDDEAHRRASDLLMMTQGWRRYNVKMMEGKKAFAFDNLIEDRLYIDGQLRAKKKRNSVDNVELSMVLFNKNGDQLAGQTVTTKRGSYAFAVPDCWRDWNLLMMTRKGDKDLDYYIGINRHFSPSTRPLSFFETNSDETVKPTLSFNAAQAELDSLPFYLKEHWLKSVNVTGKRKWKNARDYWEREGSGKKNAVVRYDCTAEADKIADQGLPMPSLIDWLETENKDFAGNDILSGTSNFEYYKTFDPNYTGLNKDSLLGVDHSTTEEEYGKPKSFFEDGLQYQRRPIMWIVNNTFFACTGMYSLNNVPVSVREWLKWDVTFPVFLDDARSVFVSVKKDDWARFLYLPELMGQPFVTVFVYTYSGISDKKTKGMRQTHFDGYAWPEEYEQLVNSPILSPAEADYRRTLYWNPQLKTDNSGKASVTFTNNSTSRSFSVSVEGFTTKGKPLTNQ